MDNSFHRYVYADERFVVRFILRDCANNHNTTYVPRVSTSDPAEQIDLQASVGHDGTKTSDIDLNPKQPVTESEMRDMGTMSNDDPNPTMCENTTSICMESIYENDSKYRLNSNDKFHIVTNKRFKKSKREKVNNSQVTRTF
jgi:hypothetical protein